MPQKRYAYNLYPIIPPQLYRIVSVMSSNRQILIGVHCASKSEKKILARTNLQSMKATLDFSFESILIKPHDAMHKRGVRLSGCLSRSCVVASSVNEEIALKLLMY